MRFLYSLQDFFIYTPYKIKYGIINLIRWFAIIWNDRQWDQTYLYEIMIKKLQLMEDYYHPNIKHNLDFEVRNKVYEDIRDAKETLIRLRDDNYYLLKAGIKNEKSFYNKDMDIFCKLFKKSGSWWI